MRLFDQDMTLAETGPLSFKTNVSRNWSINGNPNGGYLMALVAGAMEKRSGKKSLLITTAAYLAKTLPGDADILIENINQSASFERWQARLIQAGKEKIRAMATFADGTTDPGERHYEKNPPELAAKDTCMQIPPMGEYTVYKNMDVRLDPQCAGWFSGSLVNVSEHKGWIRFVGDRPFDALSVLLAADAFPPPVFASHGMTAWVPTIEFSINIRNLPQTPWLKCIFRTRFITSGILEEDGEVWDETGELVAVSRQIAQFRKKSG